MKLKQQTSSVILRRPETKFIVVHCSASPPEVYVDAGVINRWHRKRGFYKIGYHFVIKRDGEVETGRDLDEIGAHVVGYNNVSVGVCMAGGVDANDKPENNYTLEQFEALKQILAGLKLTYPEAEILGHRDLPNVRKDCPCFDVRAWIKSELTRISKEKKEEKKV